ncbi:MAG: glycosyltransferase family 4 protein [Anaerolineae bacterium]|nr:glycosyltransferase family 4 protein [Anaerolineae bacterium]
MTINLLFTSWYSGVGGGETDLLTQAEALDPQRFRPHLLLPRAGELGEQWAAHGWPVHYEHWRGASTYFVPQIWARFPVVKRMAALLKRANIGLVHADYHTLPLIQPAAEAAGIPLMWTCHGWWFHPKPWQRGFFRSLTGTARSHAIRDGFLGDPPFMSPENLPVIYSGIDTKRFAPGDGREVILAEAGVPAGSPIVAMVARFQEVKGHHHFLAMAKLVLQTHPGTHFLIAGENAFGVAKDATYRQRILDTIAADAQLSQHVHLLGFRTDVEHVLQAADVVVCPSDFESYGKVNLEAMACAVPVVSTNRGGPAEIVRDGETGYLVNPANTSEMATAVSKLLADKVLRQRIGQQARAYVQANFSIDIMAKQYELIFQRLLKDV